MSVGVIDRRAFAPDQFPQLSGDAVMRIPQAIAARYNVLAYDCNGGDLHVLVTDAEDEALLDRVRSVTGLRIIPREMPAAPLRARIAAAYALEDDPCSADDLPPAIQAVDLIHEQAVRNRSSDIHIEPTLEGGRVRERIDGLLHEQRLLSPPLFAQVVSRIKLLAGMDIADRRQPQDGRYQITVLDRSVDARVSSMPTISGEKLVIRLLDMHAQVPSLESLGMFATILHDYRELVHAPHGFVVVCGPTGSGKTTTLYASLAERNVPTQHLCTVEDPVEVRIPGIAQVQVNERAGMTFANALRSFVRQDPNVLMIGEMRDTETAKVAISAALCGQLVLTTLHAADAPRAIERLVELGLERHSIAAGLSGIVAQRLVRRLCTVCRERVMITANEGVLLGIRAGSIVYEARGCGACANTGYRGRTAIFEFLPITPEVRIAIAAAESSVSIAERARTAGYRPMLEDGWRAIFSGETSAGEIRRVLAFESSR